MTIFIWEAILLILQYLLSFTRKVAVLYCWAKLTLLKGELSSNPLKVEFQNRFYFINVELLTLNFIRFWFWDYDSGSFYFAIYIL